VTASAAAQSVTGRRRPATGGRFTVVDELNCYFDSPAEPNCVHLEVWLPGQLHPGRLSAAIEAALDDLPRARARRAPASAWRTRYAWEYPPRADIDPLSVIRWNNEDDLARARARFLATAPPLDCSPPFRLLLAQGPSWDSVILNAHHAAFDGRSCLLLLRAIAQHYDGCQTSPAGLPGPVNGQPSGIGLPADGRATAGQPRLPVQRTARIAPQHSGGQAGHQVPGYGFSLLGWPGVPVPQQRSRSRVTVNDVLIASLVQAIIRWNAGRRWQPARVRITMPVDTRTPAEHDELGNLSRLCTISVDPARSADLSLVVAAQSSQAKLRPGPQVSPALAALARTRLPVGVKRWLLRLALRCVGRLASDTCLLSNLGSVADPPGFGLGQPGRMWFSTSAHMPRGLSVGAVTVAGRLHLCFRFRNALFDQRAADDFAAEYASALSALAAGAHR
jgi:NRPS condensation-like uncharacterized protein